MTWSLRDLRTILPDTSIDLSKRIPSVAPINTQQLIELVRLASSKQLKICSSGTASHLVTEDLPDDCLIVSSRRMNRVIDFSPNDLHITLESGVLLGEIRSALDYERLTCECEQLNYTGTIGGAFALGVSSASDSFPVSMIHCVTAVSVVMPYGKLLRVGAVTMKSVAGYDIARFLAGSRGRFGFIASVTLRLTSRSQLSTLSKSIAVHEPVIRPVWRLADPQRSAVEQNLKSNLDPAGIFPY